MYLGRELSNKMLTMLQFLYILAAPEEILYTCYFKAIDSGILSDAIIGNALSTNSSTALNCTFLQCDMIRSVIHRSCTL